MARKTIMGQKPSSRLMKLAATDVKNAIAHMKSAKQSQREALGKFPWAMNDGEDHGSARVRAHELRETTKTLVVAAGGQVEACKHETSERYEEIAQVQLKEAQSIDEKAQALVEATENLCREAAALYNEIDNMTTTNFSA